MFRTNTALQKEQSHLYELEKKIVHHLPKIQEALNSLKVEELHLKSQLLNQKLSQVDASSSDVSIVSPENIVTPDDQTNPQEIDLDLFVNKLQQFDVENDSD